MGGGGGATAEIQQGQTGRSQAMPMDMSAINNALKTATEINAVEAQTEKTKTDNKLKLKK